MSETAILINTTSKAVTVVASLAMIAAILAMALGQGQMHDLVAPHLGWWIVVPVVIMAFGIITVIESGRGRQA